MNKHADKFSSWKYVQRAYDDMDGGVKKQMPRLIRAKVDDKRTSAATRVRFRYCKDEDGIISNTE